MKVKWNGLLLFGPISWQSSNMFANLIMERFIKSLCSSIKYKCENFFLFLKCYTNQYLTHVYVWSFDCVSPFIHFLLCYLSLCVHACVYPVHLMYKLMVDVLISFHQSFIPRSVPAIFI